MVPNLVRTSVPLICALALIAAAAIADDTEIPDLETGSRIRITLIEPQAVRGDPRITGYLVSLDDRVLTLEGDVDGLLLDLPRDRIDKLEISYQDITPWEGAAMGIGVTMFAGMVAGLLMKDDPLNTIGFSGETKGLLLGVLLTPIGAIAGFAEASREQWHALPPERIRLGFGGCGGGAPGMAVSIRF